MIADVGDTSAVAELMHRVTSRFVRTLAWAISLVEDGAGGAVAMLSAREASHDGAFHVGISGLAGMGRGRLGDEITNPRYVGDEHPNSCAPSPRVLTGSCGLSGKGSPRLDHIGIAVKSIAGVRGFYESLGMVVGHEEAVEHEQVSIAMLALGESRLELLQATAEDSRIGRFIAKRGEGLHHIAIHADDLDGKFAEMKREGVRLASEEIKVGAGGHRYFFVHPASTGGVLVEVVGE